VWWCWEQRPGEGEAQWSGGLASGDLRAATYREEKIREGTGPGDYGGVKRQGRRRSGSRRARVAEQEGGHGGRLKRRAGLGRRTRVRGQGGCTAAA
jgi:hypothetical protein